MPLSLTWEMLECISGISLDSVGLGKGLMTVQGIVQVHVLTRSELVRILHQEGPTWNQTLTVKAPDVA